MTKDLAPIDVEVQEVAQEERGWETARVKLENCRVINVEPERVPFQGAAGGSREMLPRSLLNDVRTEPDIHGTPPHWGIVEVSTDPAKPRQVTVTLNFEPNDEQVWRLREHLRSWYPGCTAWENE